MFSRTVPPRLAWGCLCFALVQAPATEPTPEPRYSALWGRQGELWSDASRLPDFSFAGYRRGEAQPPARDATANVKQFGAVGDGLADDTAAFRKALDTAKGQVISVPPGRYRITDFLTIRDHGTVLRGAGPDQSILFFPVPLNTVKPNWGATTTGQPTSNYSWSGGFLQVLGNPPRQRLAQVTSAALRGDRSLSLALSQLDQLHPGDDVLLRLTDSPDKSLARHLYADDSGPIDNLKGVTESFACRIISVDPASGRVVLDRPLRTDVRPEWQPTLFPATSDVEEVGIENLGFHFPSTPYRGHFTELGFNAISIRGARHCWLRDLRIHNCDSGLFVAGSNVSIHGLVLDSDRPEEKSRQATGHHGITLNGQDNLLTDFEFRTRFMHDVTMTRGSAGNVVARGRGPDLCFDHHGYAPHANLFTDIDLGDGSRMFQSGGGAKLGRHSGAYETFWNIRARRAQSWPNGWGPDRMNLVGLQSRSPSETNLVARWFESIAPAQLDPANLHAAQLARRLGHATGVKH